MRLSDFIIKNLEPILQAWEDFARTIEVPGEALDSKALRGAGPVHRLRDGGRTLGDFGCHFRPSAWNHVPGQSTCR